MLEIFWPCPDFRISARLPNCLQGRGHWAVCVSREFWFWLGLVDNVADSEKSSKTPLPWVLLTGILGIFAVGVPQTGTSTTSAKKEEKKAEEIVQPAMEERLKPVFDFHRTHDRALSPENELRHNIHGFQTEFLIACVPDPLDSPFGYAFDAVIDSIQRAVERKNGYVYDRCWLPWEADKKAKPGPDGKTKILRTDKPGVLLFRHHKDLKRGINNPGLCVVFLIGETPTAGIHKKAMTESLEIMRDVGLPAGSTVRIVGPYFSGSQTSLQFTINDWPEKAWLKEPTPKYHFSIVTGNATAVRRDDLVTLPSGKSAEDEISTIDFTSTVVPTRITLNAVLDYLTKRDGSLANETIDKKGSGQLPGKVAILTESGTGFGRQIAGGQKSDEVITLRFPLHISRIKSESAQAFKKKDEQSGLANTDPLSVSIAEDLGPTDGVPSQGGLTTTASNGQVLARILQTIAREQCRYVGVVASDTRDKLFLTRLVREYCPDVRVFVTGADLLLAHPEYRYHMRGVIVGSTYPLTPRNQRWVDGTTSERILFPTVGTQGIYNAILVHMGLQNQMLEYRAPSFSLLDPHPPEAEQRPPIWISVVAPNGTLIPLHLNTSYDDKSNYVYLNKTERPEEESIHVVGLEYPGAMLPVAVVLIGFWGYLIARAFVNPYTRLFWKGGSLLKLPDLAYRNIILGAQVIFAAPILSIAMVHASAKGYQSDWSTGLVGIAVVLILGLFLGMIRPLIRKGVGQVLRGKILPQESAILPTGGTAMTRAETLSWLVLNLAIFFVVIGFVCVFLTRFWTIGDSTRRALFFIRAVDLGSGLSPLTPMLFVCASFTAWAFFQLKRSYLIDRFHVPTPYSSEKEFEPILTADELLREEMRHESVATRHAKPLLISVVAIGAFGMAVWLQSLPTVEGWAWDIAFFVGFAFLFVLSATTLIRMFFLWGSIKKLLLGISALPMMRAFSKLPLKIAEVFGKSLFTQRPHLSHLNVPAHQLRLLAEAAQKDLNSPEALRTLDKTADEIEAILQPHLSKTSRKKSSLRAAREAREKLNTAAGLCLTILTRRGKQLPVDEAFGSGSAEATETKTTEPEWVTLAESVAATQVVIYLSQFFVQLRNLVWASVVTSSLLLMAATSYPFHPEKLLLVGLLVLSGLGIAGVTYVLIEMNRDELVSRISRTTPGRFSFDTGFIGSFATYIIPTVGVLSAQLSGSFRWALEPLLRVLK